MITFLHTSDWQLGMTRRFLDADAAGRFAHDRLERIRDIGRIVRERGCAFVVAAGDVFEANEVAPKTVRRALAALAEVPAPVFLLPGNHDALTETSVFRSRAFVENKPPRVTVLDGEGPFLAAEGVELAAAPWRAKRTAENPLQPLLRKLEPAGDRLRIVVAHGEVDALAPMSSEATHLSLEAMRRAVADGRAHFIALGDKHSPTRLDSEGRVWYSGTPEATAFREPNPGFVNIVRLSRERAEVESVRIGAWAFTEIERTVAGADDVRELLRDVAAFSDKERRVLRLRVGGVLGMAEATALEERLTELRDLFASFECDRETLHVGVRAEDIEASGLTGFARAAAFRLKEEVDAGGRDAATARNALLLLAALNKTGSVTGSKTGSE